MWFLLLIAVAFAFPKSQDPFSLLPETYIDAGVDHCTLYLGKNVNFSSFNGEFSTKQNLSSCHLPPPWDYVFVSIWADVSGVQFDRYGSFWLNGVEVVHLTTPEPDGDEISWQVNRDITEYQSLLFTGEVSALMSIPNVVTSVYTGAIIADLNVYIYSKRSGERRSGVPSIAPLAPPLAQPTAPSAQSAASSSSSSPRGFTTSTDSDGVVSPEYSYWLYGDEATSAALPLPVVDLIRTQSLASLTLDVYHSGHECEEDWYTTPPRGMGGSETLSAYHQAKRVRRCLKRGGAMVGGACEVSSQTGGPFDAAATLPPPLSPLSTAPTSADDAPCDGGMLRMVEVNVTVLNPATGQPRSTNTVWVGAPVVRVYSGGINPLLWRPLVAPGQLDIPPLRIDLTAAAALMVEDPANTYITLRVVNNSAAGRWYVNPVLLYTEVIGSQCPAPDKVLILRDSGLGVHEIVSGGGGIDGKSLIVHQQWARAIVLEATVASQPCLVVGGSRMGADADGVIPVGDAAGAVVVKGSSSGSALVNGLSVGTFNGYNISYLQTAPTAGSFSLAGAVDEVISNTYEASREAFGDLRVAEIATMTSTQLLRWDARGRRAGAAMEDEGEVERRVVSVGEERSRRSRLPAGGVWNDTSASLQSEYRANGGGGGESEGGTVARPVKITISVNARGVYSRSESNHTLHGLMTGLTNARYSLSDSADDCITFTASSVDGYIAGQVMGSSVERGNCAASIAALKRSVCGEVLCGPSATHAIPYARTVPHSPLEKKN